MFSNKQIENRDEYKIIKLIYLSPRTTTPETMNTIICEKNIILLQKKYNFDNENVQRQYEPRYSIYKNKNSSDLTIEDKNVLDNYKIYDRNSNPNLNKKIFIILIKKINVENYQRLVIIFIYIFQFK